MGLKDILQRHPLKSYFGLAFGISWLGILTLLAAKGWCLNAIQMPEVLIMLTLMLLGPSSSGLILAGVVQGRQGWTELWEHWRKWRVGWSWYGSYTGWLVIISPVASFQQNLLWQGFFGAGLWLFVAVAVNRGRWPGTVEPTCP